MTEENIKKVLDKFEEIFEEHLYMNKPMKNIKSKRYEATTIEYILRLFRQSKIKLEVMLWNGEI